jgi:hypothetical protein
MGETQIAVKTFNDFYFPKVARCRSNKFSFGLIIFKAGLFVQNVLCRLKLMNWGLAVTFVFKGNLPLDIRNNLLKNGFRVIDLPKNPYLTPT